jgi:hypothetical protein
MTVQRSLTNKQNSPVPESLLFRTPKSLHRNAAATELVRGVLGGFFEPPAEAS